MVGPVTPLPRLILPPAVPDSDTLSLIQLVYLDFAGGAFRAHSGVGIIDWRGHDWLGTGNLGSISAVGESTELQPAKVQISLSGLPAEIVGLSLREHYQGRRAQIWLALLDGTVMPSGFAPFLIFSGRIDSMQGVVGEEGAIACTLESRLADWTRPRTRRYTPEDQRQAYPADRGFDFVSEMSERELLWGTTRR